MTRVFLVGAVGALVVGCGVSDGNEDTQCPAGLVRSGDRCLPPAGDSDSPEVEGCVDANAANYDPTATTDDGSCMYDVTFEVDMSCSAETFNAVFITGAFCTWCSTGYPLTDPDTDGIWTGVYAFPPGDLEYNYMVDDGNREDLVGDTEGVASCASVTDESSFANRELTIVEAPLTRTETYGSCTPCPQQTPFDLFADDYAPGVTFAGFDGATNSLSVSTDTVYAGSASLQIDVPISGYTGGALVTAAVDLSTYDAVTLWVKASEKGHQLDVMGLGNDATSNIHQAEVHAIPLTTEWTQAIIPIPLASKLTAEAGLFHFAEGAGEGAYTLWMDQIRYEALGRSVLGSPTPAMTTETIAVLVGDTFGVNGTVVSREVDSGLITSQCSKAYFDYFTTDDTVANVDALGVGTAIGVGTAEITAKLGEVAVVGTLTANVNAASTPTTGATAPTRPSDQVISLFSDAYTDVPVDTWSADWDQANLSETVIDSDNVKQYTSLVFAGVEFKDGNAIDASAMTYLHMDLWMPAGDRLTVQLVDFGADGTYEPQSDNSQSEVTVDALTPGTWNSIDIPLTDFNNLAARDHLAQMIISSAPATLYFDNVYFYQD